MLKLLWSWTLTAIAGAICYVICNRIPLEGIPAVIVFGIIGSIVAVVVFVAGNSFLPEFKDALAFALKLVGAEKIMAKLGIKISTPEPVKNEDSLDEAMVEETMIEESVRED